MASHIECGCLRVSNNKDLVKLPGPAYWWLDDYDLQEHGFEVDADTANARRAYLLIIRPSYGAKPPIQASILSTILSKL